MINPLLKFQRRAKCKIWKKWQLFHATDFQSLMYPCFAFCYILAIFPYKINASTFESSKQRYILLTVMICSLCIWQLVTLYELNIAKTIYNEHLPWNLQRNCFCILSGFFAVVTYISNGPRMQLLQTIMNISSRVSLDSYRKLSRLIHAKDIFGFFFLIGQAFVYFSMRNSDDTHNIWILYVMLVMFQMDMLHMNCVCVLKACFKEINDNLTNLWELMVNDESHLVGRINHERRNPFLLMELKALKKKHLEISDTVQMLNKIFSLQVLATIIMTFSEITFHLYFYILHWKIGILMNDKSHQLYDVLLITSTTYHCVKIVLIGWACDTGADQAARIGTTIHEILNSTIDKQVRDELQLFSLQVLHHENTFSAKGLIIDVALLIAIIGNITTYLLILIQFLVAQQVCNDKVANNVTQSNYERTYN